MSPLLARPEIRIQLLKLRVKSAPPNLDGRRVWEGWLPKGKSKCFYQKERQTLGRAKNHLATLSALLLPMPSTPRAKAI